MSSRMIGSFVVAAVLAVAAPATAEERTCRGTIGAVTVDNLRVPQEATCTLEGTRVEGTIKVERAATLRALDVRVIGNLQAENASNVVVRRTSRINGAIQVVQGKAARIVNSTIGDTILLDENTRMLTASRNQIGGDLQVFQNTGGVEIEDNRIDGNLQCKENRPRPTGGGNIVQGNKEDQCARL